MRLPFLLLLHWNPCTAFVSQQRGHKQASTKLHVDKGFNLLEQAVIPQGPLVATVKLGWKFIWSRMMAELAPQSKDGNYERPKYSFDGRIGTTDFPDEPGRYHVYLGGPCPWCHRVKLALNLRGISNRELSVTQLIDDPTKATRGGWILSQNDPDPLFTAFDLRGVYDGLLPGFEGRCTAPLLVDKKTKQIVSNESSDIVRMLNKCNFRSDIRRLDLVPPSLSEVIDATNAWTYDLLNNGVYRCGFSTTQKAYDEASTKVLEGLEKCNDILSSQLFLCGSTFTEADLRLLPTILRYDAAYGPLFKAGGVATKINNYPHLLRWLRQCWGMEGIPESIDLAQACGSYYAQLFPLNPGGIVPTPPTAKSLGLE
jgi:glutathionyl-hydroquinone reductase